MKKFNQIMLEQELSPNTYVPNAKNLKTLSNIIYISKNASKDFMQVKTDCAIANGLKIMQETAFLLKGVELPDGRIILDEFERIETTRDVFNGSSFGSWEDMDERIEMCIQKYSKIGKPIIFMCHTHPAKYGGRTEQESKQLRMESNSWSSADFSSCREITSHYSGRIQIADLLITPSLDVNTLYFETDERVQKFYRFPKVMVYNQETGKYDEEKSYSDVESPYAVVKIQNGRR